MYIYIYTYVYIILLFDNYYFSFLFSLSLFCILITFILMMQVENTTIKRRPKHIFQIAKELIPEYFLDSKQFKKLWKSLFTILYKDKLALDVERKDEHLEKTYNLNIHEYDANIFKRIIFVTDDVKNGIFKWVDENKTNLTLSRTVNDAIDHDPNDDGKIKELYEDPMITYFINHILDIIFNYAGYNMCKFCKNDSVDSRLNFKWISYLCQTSPICKICNVSYIHHYSITSDDHNIQNRGIYNNVMKPILSKFEKSYGGGNYRNPLMCPFGICGCCYNKIPSFYWSWKLSFRRNTYATDEIIEEFESQIKSISCHECPTCRPKINDHTNDHTDDNYTCTHVKKRELTFFE